MSSESHGSARRGIPRKDQHSEEKQTHDASQVEPGMVVEATQGDLGETDVSKPRVTDVVQDAQGNVEKIVVSKGVVFKKLAI